MFMSLPQSHVAISDIRETFFLFFFSKSNYLIYYHQLESFSISRDARLDSRRQGRRKRSLPPYRATSTVFILSLVFLEIRYTSEILSCSFRRSFKLYVVLFEYVCRCYPCGKAAESGAAAL